MVRADSGHGKPAQTTVRLLEGSDQACLVACKLHTGRTHQIRVHMAWLSHPLVGDTLYGGRVQWNMNRQALHAARLQLRHPTTGEPLLFRSAPPQDMRDAMAECGLRYNEARVASGFLD